MSLHEHAPRDEEEVDVVDHELRVVVVLHAVVAVFEIGVGVLVLGEEADGEVVVGVGGVLAERFEGRAAFEQQQRVELDDREHEEWQGGGVFLLGTARCGLELDYVIVSDESVRHGVRDMLGREADVVFRERQLAVPVAVIRVRRRDGMQPGRFAAHAQDKHEPVLPREARDFLLCSTLGQRTRHVHDVLCCDRLSEIDNGERKTGVRIGMRG